MSLKRVMSAEAELVGNPRKAALRALFTGMDWFPDCKDGGLDRYFFEAVRAFGETGMDGTALVSSAASASLGSITVRGVAGPGAPGWRRWAGSRSLAKEALSRDVDLVSSHFALYAIPWLRDLPPHVPFVFHFHGPWAGEMRAETGIVKRRLASNVAHWIEQTVYRRADRCITLSTAFRDLLHKEYGVPLDRIRVIPGGVDLARYLAAPERKTAREILGWPQDRRILLAVRRLTRRMGLDLLIDAISDVRQEFPDVLVLIAGKGSERERLRRQIEAHGLTEHVRLPGFLAEEDLPAAYAAAEVSVVPTVALEGFGLVTVESLACGTPVLGTDVGGTAEILRPLDSQLLFAETTSSAMADRIRAVLRGTIPLPDQGTCRTYVQRYSWSVVIPRLLAVFQEAIEERRRRP